jgi:hypothetical protein
VSTGQAASPRGELAVGSAAMRAAVDIARAHWGVDACGGAVTVRWVRMADPTINALSSWRSFGPAYANPAANRDCSIELNTAARFDRPKLCTVLVHEYGHLAGHPHDARGGRLMSPLYTTPLPACEDAATARRAPGSRRSATRHRAG